MAALWQLTVDIGNDVVPVEVLSEITNLKEYIRLKRDTSERDVSV